MRAMVEAGRIDPTFSSSEVGPVFILEYTPSILAGLILAALLAATMSTSDSSGITSANHTTHCFCGQIWANGGEKQSPTADSQNSRLSPSKTSPFRSTSSNRYDTSTGLVCGARLEIEWKEHVEGTPYNGQMSLVSTSGAESQRETGASLAADARFDHVEIELRHLNGRPCNPLQQREIPTISPMTLLAA
jgi:hypothetical protein